MKNEALRNAMSELEKADSKTKTFKQTGNHLFGKPPPPQLETAKPGTFHFFATTRNPTSNKGDKQHPRRFKKAVNMWTGISGAGLLKPSLTRSEMRRIVQEGKVPDDKEELEKLQANLDLANAVNELQHTIQMDAPESNYTFPDEEYEFDLADAVRTSIASYKKAKQKFGMMEGSGDRYSSILKV